MFFTGQINCENHILKKYRWRNINDFGLNSGHLGWIRPISDIILHFYLFNKTHHSGWDQHQQPYPELFSSTPKKMSVERLLNFLEMEIYTSKGKVSSIDFRTAKFKNLSFNDSLGQVNLVYCIKAKK